MKQHAFTFKLVEEKDLPLLLTWFKQPHVDQWWPVPAEHEDFFNAFLKRIRSGTVPYLVLCDDKPIGYVQRYIIDRAGKHSWLPEISGNVVGTDQFIGEPEYLAKGFGPLMIKVFIDYFVAQDPTITIIIVDPEPENVIAIRCYEKVGFKKIGTYQAPWGPAVLMVYEIKK
jgi:RimJ/RimL family protein N-acetyltransferase